MPEILGTLSLDWDDENDCQRSAQALAGVPCVWEALITIEGPLGAGKTTWVRHLLHALGVTGRIKSPTFALMETYPGRKGPIAHLDFYRFERPTDWEDAGMREILLQPGLKLVEWPSKARGLPTPDLHAHIELLQPDEGPESQAEHPRLVQVGAYTPCGLQLMQALGAVSCA